MRLACTAVLFLTSLAPADEPVLMPGQPLMPMLPAAPLPTIPPEVEIANEPNAFSCPAPTGPACSTRKCFQSDCAFPNFIGPISNPFLAKDPRSLTEARFLFINNEIPEEHPLDGGNFQSYTLQLRGAVTERLQIFIDKNGFSSFHPGAGDNFSGWLNTAAGFKYALVRDVESQTLVVAGLQYEIASGEKAVFQGIGEGVITPFVTIGKEFGHCCHAILNAGYQFPANDNSGGSFYYASLHLDRQFFGWLYPLVEANWYHWVSAGDEGPPPGFGEGDGLFNLGTQGVEGNDLVTVAAGLKARCSDCLDVGLAWEKSVTGRQDFLDHRLLFECILRY